MLGTCLSCSKEFDAPTDRRKFCSDKCRQKYKRENPELGNMQSDAATPQSIDEMSLLLPRVRETLIQGGTLNTAKGDLALTLAYRIDSQPKMSGTAVASLSRELRLILDELENRGVVEDDMIDILKKRRAQRLGENQ